MAVSPLVFAVKAETSSAVSGFRKLAASLKPIDKEADAASQSLAKMAKTKVSPKVDDKQIAALSKEIARLQDEMRKAVEMNVDADTRPFTRKINAMQSTIKALSKVPPVTIPPAKTSGFMAKLSGLKSAIAGLGGGKVGQIGSTIAAGFGKVGDVLGTVMGKVGDFGSAVGSAFKSVGVPLLGTALAGVAALGTALGGTAIKALSLADNMERTKLQMDSFIHSTTKTNKLLKQVQEYADQTPFEFPELAQASKMLLGLGKAPSTVVPQLKKIGDIAAQSGASVQELTTIYTQMISSGKLNSQDMMQLITANVNAWPTLAKSMGKSVGQVKELASEGKIGTRDIQKFWDTLGKGAKGSTAALAGTLSGMISTLKDTFNGGLRDIGEALLPFAKVIVPQLTAATKGMGDKIASVLPSWIETLANGAKSLVDFGGKIMGGMKSSMVGLLNGIAGFQSSLGDMLGSFGGLAMSIAKALVFVPGMGKIAVELAKSGKGMVDAGDNMKTASAKTAAAAVQAGKSWDKWIAEYNKGANKAKDAITGAQLKSALVFSTGNANKQVDSLTAKLKTLGKQKQTAKVRADTSAAQAKLRTAKAWLDQLNKYQANPKLLATDLASGKVKYVKGQLQSVPKSKQVALNAKDNTKGPTTSAKKNIKDVPSSKHSNLTATDGITPKAKNAKTAINNIPGSKTFTLNYHTNYSTKGNPSGFSPSNVPHSASVASSSSAPTTVQIYVNDQALAGLIDVRINGRAARASRVVRRKDPVRL